MFCTWENLSTSIILTPGYSAWDFSIIVATNPEGSDPSVCRGSRYFRWDVRRVVMMHLNFPAVFVVRQPDVFAGRMETRLCHHGSEGRTWTFQTFESRCAWTEPVLKNSVIWTTRWKLNLKKLYVTDWVVNVMNKLNSRKRQTVSTRFSRLLQLLVFPASDLRGDAASCSASLHLCSPRPSW